MASPRLSTGITGLDTLLQGGLLRGRTYLFSGASGTGKTIACLQFTRTAVERDDKIVYVTLDERPAELTDSANALGWDLQPALQDKRLVILDASPYFGGRSANSGEKGIDPGKIVADLSNYIKRLGATILVVDPITPLILPSDTGVQVQEQARAMINLLQTQLTTTNIFTAYDFAASAHDQTFSIEKFLASGSFSFRVSYDGDDLKRTVTIHKMRATAVQPGTHGFTIRSGDGIVLGNISPAPTLTAIADPTASIFEQFQLNTK